LENISAYINWESHDCFALRDIDQSFFVLGVDHREAGTILIRWKAMFVVLPALQLLITATLYARWPRARIAARP